MSDPPGGGAPPDEPPRPLPQPATEAPTEDPGAVPGAPTTASPQSGLRATAIVLAVLLIAVLAMAGTAPWWAPALPCGPGATRAEQALSDRLDALAVTEQQDRQRLEQSAAALARLDGRVAATETQAGESAELRRQTAKLADAVGDLARRSNALDQRLQAQIDASADRDKRLAVAEQALQAQAAPLKQLADRADAIEQAMRKQQGTVNDLSQRIAGITANAEHRTADAALTLALLQVRTAIDAGRPFQPEYQALTALGQANAELAAAAAPLAEPAKTGVATRAVLTKELHALAGQIAEKDVSDVSQEGEDWIGAVLARIRGLVRIRRLEGPPDGPRSQVNAAESALAGGDLAGAIEHIEKLTGAAAEAAAPWLRMARERLAVEQAVEKIEALVTTRLGQSSDTGPVR